MKNIFKSILAVTILAGFASCEDEQDLRFVDPAGEFRILSPVSGESVTLLPETPTNPALSLAWESMDFGTPTEITYTVEVDRAGDNFDTPIALTSTSNTYATVTVEALNNAASDAGLEPFEQGGLEVRIKAAVAAADPVYSTSIAYLVTTYSTDLPKLYLPGSYQDESGYGSDWTHATAATLAAAAFGQTDYEGYVYIANDLTGSDGFKFTDAPNWDNGIYGDDGTFSGLLASPGDNVLINAGYYRMNVDTDALTYSATPTQWGIVGAATPGGWDLSTALTYNPTDKVWEGDVTMTAGEFKFRANNAWDINLGADGNADGSMDYGGGNLSTPAGGSFHVVLDLSNPRMYTYTITAN